jgi:predicted Zn-dependent protease
MLLLREIVNGKLGAVLEGANFLFNTSQFWNDVVAIGGRKSAEWHGLRRMKGQPAQQTTYSVSAVPIVVKDMAIIDSTRKA